MFDEQSVEIIRYKSDNTPDIEKLKRAIDVGYILVKFTETVVRINHTYTYIREVLNWEQMLKTMILYVHVH